MITKVAVTRRSYQLRSLGWQIWYYQNSLFLILFVILPINLFLSIVLPWWGDWLGAVVNLLFNVCMFLDLFSISLITSSFLFDSYREGSQLFGNRRLFLGVFAGSLWIMASFLWRFPFFLISVQNVYQSGIGFRVSWLYSGQPERRFLPPGFDFISNPLQSYLFFAGGFFLFIFLHRNDVLLSETSKNR
ncbi:MAG: hypothetical protein ACFFE8_15785 [Candidatus Heimdallarchaeota archaeon]